MSILRRIILASAFAASIPVFSQSFEYDAASLGMDSINRLMELKMTMKGMGIDAVNETDGRIIKHIVERGETWESIATKYQIPPTLLTMLNPFEDDCLSGLEIDVAVYVTDEEIDEMRSLYGNSIIMEADKCFNSGDLKKAVKLYTSVLKDNKSAEIYYKRGIANYKRDKLSPCIDDLKCVVSLDKSNRFPDAADLLLSAEERLEAKRESRRQFWCDLASTVLEVGMYVGQAYLQSQYADSYSSTSNSYAGSSSGLNSGYSGSALNIEIPPCLNLANYAHYDIGRTEYQYDQYGNIMVSYPGLADMQDAMQRDFSNYMNNSGLLNANTSLNGALRSLINIDNRMTAWNSDYLRTFHYPVDYSAANDSQGIESDYSNNNTYDNSSNSDRENNMLSSSMYSLSKTYDNYISQLIDMKTNPRRYSDSNRISIQNSMRDIRQKASSYGNNVISKSSWEDWDGSN